MSTLRLTTISNQSGSSSVPSDTVINGSAKAWVNFNGTGTVAIRASFNVSSITDNGTGDYTVNLTNAMLDTNGVAVGASVEGVGAFTGGQRVVMPSFASTSTVRVGVTFQNGGVSDNPYVGVSIFR